VSNPIVEQIRRLVVMADGNKRWEVTTKVVNKGDLPFPELFVLTIADPSDPKQDVLARVAVPHDLRNFSGDIYVKVASTDITYLGGDTFARIANTSDLTSLPRDRVIAVQKNATEYLVSAMTKLYDALVTADAAGREIVARLSDLQTEWAATTSAFIGHITYTLPVVDPSVQAERRTTYTSAKAARIEAESERNSLAAQSASCDASQNLDKAIYDLLASSVALLEKSRSIVVGLDLTLSPIPDTKDYVLGQGAFSADPTTYEVTLVQTRADLEACRQRLQTGANTCAALSSQLLVAQSAVTSARAAEDTALANLRAVCPTFTP